MQDYINSFKAHLYERTASPLLGSFVFYWIICNYKFIVILIDGDMKANEKFELIKTIYPQNIWIPWEGFEIHYSTILGNGFLLPLLISLLYIFISPFPSKWIYKFWKNKQREILEIKQKIDDETPLTKEQSRKIRQDIINLELEYEKIFKRKEEENKQLKTMLDSHDSSYNNEIEKLKQEIQTIHKIKEENSVLNSEKKSSINNDEINTLELNNDEINALKLIGNDDSGISAVNVSNQFKIHQIKANNICNNLMNKKYIKTHPSYNEGYFLITEKGSNFLLENNLI